YDVGTPTPLVICIHGFVQWPANQMEVSGWNDLADEFGFIVVYPSGTGFPLRWNAHAGFESGSDPMEDVTFISDLIDQLPHAYNIDERRLYANGLSNGGGMSHLLACTLSDRIAAIGSVAGAYSLPWSQCNPSRPVPVIAFHGTNDQIVPYSGGGSHREDLSLPAVLDWVAAWAEQNECGDTPLALPSAGEASGIVYTGCSEGAGVVFYTIRGGGHAWPGGEPLPEWIVGHTTQDINASEVMWTFFEQHPKDSHG
ncbi:MAG: polyhydroxybutyrate depolymerase, partial [Anaerolineales bacterium]